MDVAPARSSVPLRKHRRRKDSARGVAGSITDTAPAGARWTATAAAAAVIWPDNGGAVTLCCRCHTAIYVIYASNKLARSIGISSSEHVSDTRPTRRKTPLRFRIQLTASCK